MSFEHSLPGWSARSPPSAPPAPSRTLEVLFGNGRSGSCCSSRVGKSFFGRGAKSTPPSKSKGPWIKKSTYLGTSVFGNVFLSTNRVFGGNV